MRYILKGAYLISIEYKGTRYSEWVIVTDPNRGLRTDIEKLVEYVIELEGLHPRMWDSLNDEVDWEFVPREELPGDVYYRLVREESYLWEEYDEY